MSEKQKQELGLPLVWLIVLSVAAVSVFAVAGLWFLHLHGKAHDQDAANDLTTIARYKQAQISDWIRDQKEDALTLQESLIFTVHASSVLENPESGVPQSVEDFFRYVAVSHDADDLVLMGLDGRVKFSLRGITLIPEECLAALAEAVRNGRPVMTDIHVDPSTQESWLSVAVPVMLPLSEPPRAVGGLLLITKASRFLDPLLQTWPVPSRTGEVLLVRREGDEVLFLSALRHWADNAMTLRMPLSQVDLVEAMAVGGQKGVVRGMDYRGAPVTAAIVPVEGTSWFLVAKADQAELDADKRVLSISMGFHWVGFAALLALAVFWARQKARKEHFRRLFQAESELRKMLVKYAVLLEAMGDAVIATDAQGCVELCNPAAEKLTGWSAGEAQGKALKDVLRIEGGPGAEIVHDPVTFLLERDGEGSLDETLVLQTRDGRRKPVAVSVTLLREESGDVAGAVFCCQDRTEEFLRRRILEIRLSLMERSHAVPLEQALAETLDAVGDLLESPVGFYASIAPDGKSVGACVWSSGVSPGFCPRVSQKGHEGLDEGSLWAKAVREKRPIIVNDDIGRDSRRQLPEGHGAVRRLVLVPVIREGSARALLAAANKESDYTEEDAGTLSLLADMIQQVVDHRQAEERLRQSEARYKRLFQDHKAIKLLIDPEDGRIVDANHAAVEFYGWTHEEITQMKIQQINTLPPEAVKERMAEVKGRRRVYFEFQHRRADGSVRDVEVYSSRIDVDGKPYLHSIIHDVTQRKQVEAERERWLTAIEQAGEVVLITDADGIIQYVNPAFEAVTGYTRQEALGKKPAILKSGLQDEAFYRNLWETLRSGRKWTGRMVNRKKDGTLYTEEATISPVKDAQGNIVNYVAVMRDISEKLHLEQQFYQAQKMESVGRLAGGVAHDYNNSLTIILGFADMALKEVGAESRAARYLQEIIGAANRSAAITRQLLAFARKQIIEPVVMDLNATVESTLKMLRRLIGEDVELVWKPGSHLWKVKMDPAQVDQILANLCVNAKDAIGGAGTITLETENVVLSDSYCATHAEFVPGDYVMLAVTDTGCGMDKETLAKIFEPFFTTKEVGKGTGLGLSTVYGIVRQNRGFVNVYSEPGVGTTFKIYIPREPEPEVDAEEAPPTVEDVPRGRGETILLVEDDRVLLDMTRVMLTQLGYTVLDALSPRDGLALVRNHEGPVHVLMTDVVMPEMNGKELAAMVQDMRPEVKVLFMSGYTANVIAHHGVLDPGVAFIQKPFGLRDLALRLRQVLDADAV